MVGPLIISSPSNLPKKPKPLEWFGENVGKGIEEADTDAWLAMWGQSAEKNIYLPQSEYFIGEAPADPEDGMVVSGASPYDVVLKATAAINLLPMTSESVFRDFRMDGQNVSGSVGFYAPPAAHASAYNVRAEHFSKGFLGRGGQNGVMEKIFCQYCKINWHLQDIANWQFISCDGNLAAGAASARNILCDGYYDPEDETTTYVRNCHMFGGIYERGESTNDYSLELQGGSLRMFGTELNTGKYATTLISGGDLALYDPHFSLNGLGGLAVLCTGGICRVVGEPLITGKGGRLTKLLFQGNVTFDGSHDVVLVDHGFLVGAEGWSAYGGSSVAHNATKKRLGVTGVGVSSGAALGLSAVSLAEQQYRMLVVDVLIRDLSAGSIDFAIDLDSGYRSMGTLTEGSNRLVYEIEGDEYPNFRMTANATWDVCSFKTTLV